MKAVDPIRVLVVDDHALFRRGLVEVLSEEPDVEVVGEAGTGPEAIQQAQDLTPDVVFMDLNIPGGDGIMATAYLSQNLPQIKVLILTVSEQQEALFKALGVGARGYMVKTSSPEDIVNALRQVHQGWVVISPSMASRFLGQMPQAPESSATSSTKEEGELATGQLTYREQELLQLIARGLSNAEIATTLVISENTVKTHVKNILGKLQAKSRREAVELAARISSGRPRAAGGLSAGA